MSDQTYRRGGGRTWLGIFFLISSLAAVLELIDRVCPEGGEEEEWVADEGGGVPVEIATAGRSDLVAPSPFREITRVALLVVPREAIISTVGGTAVLLYRNGRAIAVPVMTGRENEAFAELLSGVREGDTVITAACGPIGDGSAVRIMEEGIPGDEEHCREWEEAAPGVVRTTHAQRQRVPSPLEAEEKPENISSLFMKGR